MPQPRSLIAVLALIAAAGGCSRPNAADTSPELPAASSPKITRTAAREAAPLANPASVEQATPDGQTGAIEEQPVQLALADTVRGKTAEITFDDLKFEIEPASRFDESMLTDKIKDLDGKRVRIRGVMWPTFQQRGNKEFILLMNKECKFGSATDPVWCNVYVQMDQGETADYSNNPIAVEGVLKIDVKKGAKYDLSVYEMNHAKLTR